MILHSQKKKKKVVLFVNVASKCGFTKQYAGLEETYKKYNDKGFVIIGAPCNQFGGQGKEKKRILFGSILKQIKQNRAWF